MLPTHPLFAPALTPILSNRKSCLLVAGAASLHVTLTLLGLPSWRCPLRYGVGIPCPGCGLSRAVDSLLHGHWHDAFQFHAFAPLVVLGLLLITLMGILPNHLRTPMVQRIDAIERQTGLVLMLLGGLVMYWLVRLLFYTKEFYQLVM